MDSPKNHADPYAQSRARMVEAIRVMAFETVGTISTQVLSVMERVPRHLFVPEVAACSAYDNNPLPIGHRQTISQPYIVALMTDLLALQKTDRVLEIGTGSGYQAAILAELAAEVYSIEIIEPLAIKAASLLETLGYGNVTVKNANGNQGWPEQAPFDGIIVTAAPEHMPQALLNQLKTGGRMVIPLGAWPYAQQLLLIRKSLDGVIAQQNILPVSFVPFVAG